MTPAQLDIFGKESPVKARRSRGLTEAQREILRIARALGKVTPLQAGVATHIRRDALPCKPPPDGNACCVNCVKDGRVILGRLATKKLLTKATRDLWMPRVSK